MSVRPLQQTDQFTYFHHFNVLPCIQLHKYITILKFIKNNEYRTVQVHGHDTRGAGTFIVTRYNNEYGRQELQVVVPKLFNSLPDAVTQSQYFSKIKTASKNWLLAPDA